MRNIKKDFPLLGRNIVYLDSSATSLKPRAVIAALNDYNSNYSANVHRGIYKLSERATDEYEKARAKIAEFFNVDSSEIVFVRNATEAINLVAYSWGEKNLKKGDNILTTIMEHHSNFVPWQELARKKGVELKTIDITAEGLLNIKDLKKKINSHTKLLAVTHVSNVLGTVNPIKEIVKIAKKYKTLVLVDGAQAAPHIKVDINNLGCDFYAVSAHKMLGPTGIGVLWARKEILETTHPFFFGGSMIEKVTTEKATFNQPPEKFEAGTPNISGAIGFGAAVDYLAKLGMDNVERYEESLKKYAYKKFCRIKGITIYGPTDISKKCAVFAFNIEGIHPHDLASILDEENICVRAGHHCAQPLHNSFGVGSSVRASFYIYNTKSDVDRLISALLKAIEIFA